MAGIGAYIKERQADGADDRAILKEVLDKFPDARTTIGSVRWYRTQGDKHKARTTVAPSARPKPADLPSSIPASLEVDGVELRQGDRGFYYVGEVSTLKGPKMRGFNATIYAGGAKVGEAIDRGDGTAVVYHWLDDGAETAHVECPSWDSVAFVDATPLEAHWMEHCMMLPKGMDKDHPGRTVRLPPDVHLGSLVDDFLVARRLQREMSGHVVFLTGGKLMRAKLEGTTEARLRRSIELKHPLARILNGMPMAEAVRLVPGAWS